MASREDCFFFFNSTCTKGDHCAFRHEKGALGSSVACDEWKNGSCSRDPCYFRHGTSETSRMPTVCFFESSPTGCLNSSCQYFHHKPRPFLTTEPQFPHGAPRPRGQRPSGPPARFTPPPYAQRLVPNPVSRLTEPLDFSGTKIPGHFRPGFPNPLPIPPNHPGGPRMLPRPAVYPVGAHDVVNTGAMPRFVGESAPPPFVPRDGRMVPSISNVPSLMSGQGIRPFDNFPGNNSRDAKQIKPGQSLKDSRSKRSSSKRTVKKLENRRNHKTEKTSKRRDETRLHQDATGTDRKRRRSKDSRLSFYKLSKDSSKRRKREKNDNSEKPKISLEPKETTAPNSDDVSREEPEDLSFKVKTLEEILRDKALKKLRERQARRDSEENSALSLDEDDPSFVSIISGLNTPSKQKTPTIIIEDDDYKSLDNVKIKTSSQIDRFDPQANPDSPRVQHRTLKPLKPLTNKKTGRQIVLIPNKPSDSASSDVINSEGMASKSCREDGIEIETAATSSASITSDSIGGLYKTITRKTLPPLRKLTKPRLHAASPEHDMTRRTAEINIKRKIDQQAYRKLVKTSRLRLTSAGLHSSEVKENPTPSIKEVCEDNDTKNGNIYSVIPGLEESEKRLTQNKVEVKRADEGQSDNMKTAQTVKKIKLARKGLKSSLTRSQEVRKNLYNGRKLRLNKQLHSASHATTDVTNVAVVSPHMKNTTRHDANAKPRCEDTMNECTAVSTNTNATNTTSANKDIPQDEKSSEVSHSLTHETKEQCVVKETRVAPNIEVEEQALIQTTNADISKQEERSNELSEDQNNITETGNNKRISDEGTKLQERVISTVRDTVSKQSSLDRIVKELKDDMICEEDDLLDEDLEKAIADLSPAATDDEDNDSINADDLLLEIEEMINS